MSTQRQNPLDLDAEARMQALAAAPPRDGEPAQVNAYRQLYAALRDAPIAEPPYGFAARMERLVLDAGEQADVEVWVQRLVAAFAVIAAAFYALPVAAEAMGALVGDANLPWPMLLGAGFALLATWMVDRAWLDGDRPSASRPL